MTLLDNCSSTYCNPSFHHPGEFFHFRLSFPLSPGINIFPFFLPSSVSNFNPVTPGKTLAVISPFLLVSRLSLWDGYLANPPLSSLLNPLLRVLFPHLIYVVLLFFLALSMLTSDLFFPFFSSYFSSLKMTSGFSQNELDQFLQS